MKKTLNVILICALVLFLPNLNNLSGGQDELAQLKDINIQKSARSVDVMIEVVGAFNYQHFELRDLSRVVIELSPVGDIEAKSDYEVNALGVKNIRVSRYRPTIVRISFDLAEVFPHYEITQVGTGIRAVFSPEKPAAQPPPPVEKKKAEPRVTVKETHLKSVSYERIGQQLQINIEASGDISFDSQVLNNNRQLAIDLWPIQRLTARSLPNINLYGLKGIDVRQTEPQTVRIALDYQEALPAFAVNRTESGVRVLLAIIEKAEVAKVREEPRGKQKPWEPYPPLKKTMLSITGGMYSVSDEIFKEIYGGSAMILGADLNQVIIASENHNFALSISLKKFSKTGTLTEIQEETKFSLMPISLGLRYLYNLKQAAPFIGGGVDFCSYKEENIIEDVSGSTTGFHIIGGLYFKIPSLDFLNIMAYAKYTSATATENEFEVSLGGFEFGGGIALGFDLF